MASGDDDIPFYVDYKSNPSKYEQDVFAQTIMSYSWTSWIRFLPPVLVQLIHLSPNTIHICLVILQNSLILLGVYYLTLSMKVPHNISFFILLVFSLSNPYLFNLSWSGDLEWMPFATWMALGTGLFAIAFNLQNNFRATFSLILLMSLTQISMAVSCLILMSFMDLNRADKYIKLKKYLLLASGLIPFFFLSLINNKEELFSDKYVEAMKSQMVHWSAWNFKGPAQNVSVSFLIFTVSTSALLFSYRKYEPLIKGIILAIVSSTIIHIVFYKISYIDGLRLNLTRITMFTSVLLFIALLDFLWKDASRGKLTILSQFSLATLMCFSSIALYPVITVLYFLRSYTNAIRTFIYFGIGLAGFTYLYLQLSDLTFPELLSRTVKTILASKTPSTFSSLTLCVVILGLIILSKYSSKNFHLSLIIFFGVVFSVNSCREYRAYFETRQFAVTYQSEAQIWARENTPINSKFILHDASTWGAWRNNSLRSVVSQDILFHPYSHTFLNVSHNARIMDFSNYLNNLGDVGTYDFYTRFAREFGGNYLVIRKTKIVGSFPIQRLRFSNAEFVVIELESSYLD
jgi:hypothetical protein